MIQEAPVVEAIDFDALAAIVDGGALTAAESATAENAYSRLAHEAHQLRLDNNRLREAIKTIASALEKLKMESVK